ncbi:hypothetical protein BKI52_18815 [marine bacterium AO1-C]|nr:hypothetical protein BKI52_18815 [marine bacterium AO1-C]
MDTLQELLQQKDFTKVEDLIIQTPELLDQLNERAQSGFMQILYSFQPSLIEKAISLKPNFTLHEAAAAGLLSQVQEALISQPNLLNEYSPDGFTAISLAAFLGKKEVVAYLLEQKADSNLAANNASKVNALHAAVAYNDTALGQMLLENGAAVNQPQMQGVTALHSAAHRGNLALVKLLVQYGADWLVETDEGKTALDFAEEGKHQEVVGYLQSI